MLSDRARSLQRSLERELEMITLKERFDQKGRRLWLLDQLDNYLDRWLGFAAVGVSLKSLLRDDLFKALLAGIHVYSKELESVDPSGPELAAWRAFLGLLSEIQKKHNPDLFASIRAALTRVRDEFNPR